MDSAIPFSPGSICLNVNGRLLIPIHLYVRIPPPKAMSPCALQTAINLLTLIPMLTRAAVCLAFSPPTPTSPIPLLASTFSFPDGQVQQHCREDN